MNRKFNVVITRHPALVEYVRGLGLVDQSTLVLTHATPDDVLNKDVCGVLPHSLSCLTKTFTEIPLALTPEMRGKELSLETIRKIAGDPVTYRVEKINL